MAVLALKPRGHMKMSSGSSALTSRLGTSTVWPLRLERERRLTYLLLTTLPLLSRSPSEPCLIHRVTISKQITSTVTWSAC